MKHYLYLLILAAAFLSCEKETLTEDYASLMTLRIENNMAVADNYEKIKIVAEFPADFSTATNKTVDFYIYKDEEEKQSATIRLVQENGRNKKIAEVYVKHDKAELLNVRAVMAINTVEISQEATIEFTPATDYTSQLSVTATNNGADADNLDKIHLVAEVPYDFPAVTEDKVDFYISKEPEEKITATLRVIESGDGLKKIAEAYVKHNKDGVLSAKAVLKTGALEVSKQISINFVRAYPESITVSASSLEISPESFNTVTITTRLHRDNGTVTLGTIANTRAYDVSGNSIGIFVDYKDKTDADGKITNSFTLGNNTYTGPITIVGEAAGSNGILEPFTLTLFSNQ